ncbi:glutamine and serine-rich protein 1-like isoform X2 [Penaeus vannamei]|uniref:glutamine and serine-rich protein 1-like isoform X2 n=1 Tax=Penaeus vannamei TaxID=6689 RepID=UPI00387F8D84
MASMSSGMANGTNKPGYMSSFMSFIENQDSGDKPSTTTGDPGENQYDQDSQDDVGQEESNAATSEITSTGVEIDPPEEDITPTDHTPADPDPTVQNTEVSANTDSSEKPSGTDGENTNSSESTTNSDAGETPASGRRNVARRGRRRSSGMSGGMSPGSGEVIPQRETPRRAARSVQRYGNIEPDGYGDSDPDFHLSDSDDDPDFNPINRKQAAVGSDEEDFKPRRGRGRGRGFGGVRGRGVGRGSGGVKRALDTSGSKNDSVSDKLTSPSSTVNPPKRRGRPPLYPQTSPSSTVPSSDDNTVSSTDDKNPPSKLSSAYNYAVARTQRQNQTIRLPEGPQLTAEQLEMVESQFKSGDFVMAKRDMDMMENPPIWRIDGKSLLQKFQAFEKDGKTLYRNISTYSGWTSQAKALYVGVKVTFVFQSRYDTVVELVGIKNGEEEPEKQKEEDEPTWSAVKNQQQDFEISEELRSHMPSFEIYLQTLISQALDNNFLMEIYEENDDYFVERVKVIDELAEQRKRKVLEIVQWNEQFRNSLDTWPCINVMITKNAEQCQACSKAPATKLSQLYGQPYNQQTLRSREPMPSEIDAKNFEVCDRCSNISQMYNKVSHQKYDYYSQCKSTVTNMRVTHPDKHTTTILRDLLANDHWIMGLFRSMCTTWIKVDRLYQEEMENLKENENDTT